jgi:hypothetical protein
MGRRIFVGLLGLTVMSGASVLAQQQNAGDGGPLISVDASARFDLTRVLPFGTTYRINDGPRPRLGFLIPGAEIEEQIANFELCNGERIWLDDLSVLDETDEECANETRPIIAAAPVDSLRGVTIYAFDGSEIGRIVSTNPDGRLTILGETSEGGRAARIVDLEALEGYGIVAGERATVAGVEERSVDSVINFRGLRLF